MPFYHIVIADGRAPRDGKFIDKIGTYNPLTKPAEIDINIDRAVEWLNNGAQPSDTVRAILSYKGVLYKKHLLTGVRKGALTQEQADMKFETWQKEKQEKILTSIKETDLSRKDALKKRHEAEAKVNEARAKELAAKRAKELEAMRKEEATAEEVPAAEVAEAPAEAVEAAPETVEATPEVAETIAEEPAAEESAEIAEVPSETEVNIPEEVPETPEAPAEEETEEPEESKA